MNVGEKKEKEEKGSVNIEGGERHRKRKYCVHRDHYYVHNNGRKIGQRKKRERSGKKCITTIEKFVQYKLVQ